MLKCTSYDDDLFVLVPSNLKWKLGVKGRSQ